MGKPAAFDSTAVFPLNSNTLDEVGDTSGSAGGNAEVRKHNANDLKCRERLGLHDADPTSLCTSD